MTTPSRRRGRSLHPLTEGLLALSLLALAGGAALAEPAAPDEGKPLEPALSDRRPEPRPSSAPGLAAWTELREPATRTLEQAELRVELFELELDTRRLHVIRARVPRGTKLDLIARDAPERLGELVGTGPLVAINGGFYDTRGRPLGLVIREGEVLQPLRRGGGSGVVIATAAGVEIVHRARFAERAAATPRIEHALQSIDRLVADGRSLVGANASPALDARAAIATFEDGSVRFYVVFDRDAVASSRCADADCSYVLSRASTSSGVSLRELAELLVSDGADDALNLDGGFSTSFEARLGDRRLSVVSFGATINALVARP